MADEIERWDHYSQIVGASTYYDPMGRAADGDWVRYEDHAAALARVEAERDEARAEAARLRSLLEEVLRTRDLPVTPEGDAAVEDLEARIRREIGEEAP